MFLLLSGGRGSITPPPIATPAPSFELDGQVTVKSEMPLLVVCGSRLTVWTTCWVAPPNRVLSVSFLPVCAIANELPPTATTIAISPRTSPGERCLLRRRIILISPCGLLPVVRTSMRANCDSHFSTRCPARVALDLRRRPRRSPAGRSRACGARAPRGVAPARRSGRRARPSGSARRAPRRRLARSSTSFPSSSPKSARSSRSGRSPALMLSRHHGADVRGHQHLEALLARHLRPKLGEQVLGDRVEQLRGGWPVLHHPVSRISSSMSHSGSQIRRPSEASSWLRRTPVRWSWAWRAQMIAHLTLPKASQ